MITRASRNIGPRIIPNMRRTMPSARLPCSLILSEIARGRTPAVVDPGTTGLVQHRQGCSNFI
jgi:hypothetical protein